MSSENLPKITPNMTVLDVVSRYRQSDRVFRKYDAAAGECICCNALFETLSDVAAKYRLDLARLISDLESGANKS
ncbi:MAG: hypothetical protein ACOCP6_00325 [Desulfosalsimonas sp.]